MQRRMNSCVEDNFKEDLLQRTGQSGQEEREEGRCTVLLHCESKKKWTALKAVDELTQTQSRSLDIVTWW